MNISSKAIINGKFLDKYGKRGIQFTENGIPNFSIPITINNPPKDTVCFAIFMEDIDAIPVCGYSWIHWIAANIETQGDITEIIENESINAKFTQGSNSWSGKIAGLSRKEASIYGGMAPPDKPHSYDLYVYALDSKLDLENGFFANELKHKMEGHILSQAKLSGIYDN